MRGLNFFDRSGSSEKKTAVSKPCAASEPPTAHAASNGKSVAEACGDTNKSSKKSVFSTYFQGLRSRTASTTASPTDKGKAAVSHQAATPKVSPRPGQTDSRASHAVADRGTKATTKSGALKVDNSASSRPSHGKPAAGAAHSSGGHSKPSGTAAAGTASKSKHGRTVPQPDNVTAHSTTLKRPSAPEDEPEKESVTYTSKDGGSKLDRSNFIVENTGKVTDFYNVESKILGTGTYGSVCKATRYETGKVRALKAISKSQVKNLDRFRREIDIMKCLDHPNILKLFETFEDHRNIYLVLELCEGGELFDRIIAEGHFTEKHAAVLMKQIFSAVNYLHANKIMHRDLKPENFLFLNSSRDSPLKIIDFGLSCTFQDGEYVSTKAGTPYYVAPQVLDGKYDYRCDAWSLGVILYILLCGYPPFYGDTDAEVLEKVKTGVFTFSGSEWRRISTEAKDLISQLLKIKPEERMTVEAALNHSWITNLAQNSENVELPSTIMGNLKGFRAQNRLKKAALTVIAQNMSESDIENLRNIFITLDVDNSGTLSVQEVREGLKRLGWNEIPPDLQAIMEDVDSDRSGNIDYTEFIAATMDRKLYMQEDVCWAAFRVFDLDGNGKISQDELRHILGMPNVADAMGQDTIQALLGEVDLDGDGEIDFDEFMHMMRGKQPLEAVAATHRQGAN